MELFAALSNYKHTQEHKPHRNVLALAYCSIFALCIASCALPSTSYAQSKEKSNDARVEKRAQVLKQNLLSSMQTIQSASSLVDANISFCFEYAEQTTPAMQAASNSWRDYNNMAYLIKAIGVMSPNAKKRSEALFGKHRKNLASQPAHERTANCNKFTEQLTSGEMNLSKNHKEVDLVMRFAKEIDVTRLRKRNLPSVQNPIYSYIKSIGIEPHDTLIPTAFNCYSELDKPFAQSSTPEPEFEVQFSENGKYKSSFGSGRYTPTWSGPLAPHSKMDIDFDTYGQALTITNLTLDATQSDYQCYQQGPRNEAELINRYLTIPENANYECSDSKGQTLPELKLISDTRYQINGVEGEYRSESLEQYSSTRTLGFNSGLLEKLSASYSKSADTGKRTLRFREVQKFVSSIFPTAASTSSLTMTCTSVGDATPYPKYGEEYAPKPPADAGGLEGVFYLQKENYRSTSNDRSRYDFFYFSPEGHMRKGEFYSPVEELDCTRTRPNGTAPCSIYKVSNTNIIVNPGEKNEHTIDRESLTRLSGEKHTIAGTFWANESKTTGMCGFDGFPCSSWYYETSISFYSNGTFFDNERTQSTNSAGFGGVSAAGFGSGSAAQSGKFTIENNVLELRYENGEVSRQFIAVVSKNTIQLGGWTLMRKSED